MIDAFLESWAATHREEMGYVNNPKDSGGATNHGITEELARAYGFTGDMRDLPLPTARSIAKRQFWDVLRGDELARISRPIASEVFDSGFLCGFPNAGKFLQRSLNALNLEGSIYRDLDDDGHVGQLTITALASFMGKRKDMDGEAVLLTCLNGEQYGYLRELVTRRQKDEAFFFGWVAKRVRLTGR